MKDEVMIYSGEEKAGLCRRCGWLEQALQGHVHPLPSCNGVPINFSDYPAIGPILTLS